MAASTKEAHRMLVLEEKLRKNPTNNTIANELAELLYRNVRGDEFRDSERQLRYY